MKLSEAIRLGATLRPQGFHRSLYYNETCAIGAALDAVGALANRRRVLICPSGVSLRDFGWGYAFTKRLHGCDLCDRFVHRSFVTLSSMIQHWNDHHHLTREQIADRVEQYEPLPVPEEIPEIQEAVVL